MIENKLEREYMNRMLLMQIYVDPIQAELDYYFVKDGDKVKFNPEILKKDRERLERAFGER